MVTGKTKALADIVDEAFKLNLTLGDDTEQNWKLLTEAHDGYDRLSSGRRTYERRLLCFAFTEYRRLAALGELENFLERKLKAADIKCNQGTALTTKFLRCLYGETHNAERRASSDGTVIAKAIKKFEGVDDVSVDAFQAWVKDSGGLDAIRKHKGGGSGGQSFEQRCASLLSELNKTRDIETIDLQIPEAKQQELIILYCVKDANNKLGLRKVCRPQQADLDKKRFDLLPAVTVHKNGVPVVDEAVARDQNPEPKKSTGASGKTQPATKRKAA